MPCRFRDGVMTQDTESWDMPNFDLQNQSVMPQTSAADAEASQAQDGELQCVECEPDERVLHRVTREELFGSDCDSEEDREAPVSLPQPPVGQGSSAPQDGLPQSYIYYGPQEGQGTGRPLLHPRTGVPVLTELRPFGKTVVEHGHEQWYTLCHNSESTDEDEPGG